MEQDNSAAIEALRRDLAELTALHAPSGSEQPVIARLYELLVPLTSQLHIDYMGNLSATLEGPASAPHVVISAHADEIGAMVARIEPDGFLRMHPLGGVQSRLLEGRAVWVKGHAGVVGARPGHLTAKTTHSQGSLLEDLYIDLGVDDAASVEAMGICVGDPITIVSELRNLAGTRVAGKGLDNRASCVVALHLMRYFYENPPDCRLTALFTVQEEVGLRGALTAFANLAPDLVIVMDTSPATGTPDTRHLPSPARIGKGTLITPLSQAGEKGFLLPHAAREILIERAQRAHIPYQLALTNGGTTDAAAAHLTSGGIPTLEVKTPRRYSHSPVELLDLCDLAATFALVKELVASPPTQKELAFL